MAAMLTVAGNIGLPLGTDGFVNVTAEYRDREDTNRAGFDPRRNYNVATVYDPREFTFDRLNHRYGDAKTEDINIFVNMGVPLDDRVELYGFASYGERDGESAGFYRRANDNRNVLAVYPDGFLPLITSRLKDYALTGGLKGAFGGWNWDLSMQYGRNEFDFRIVNSVNASLGATSPTEFDSGGLRYSQWVNNLDVSREIETGFLERATLSAGLEYRRETFQIRAGELASYQAGPVRVGENNPQFTGAAGNAFAAPGAQVFPGFQPIVGGVSVTGENARENFSAYAELDLDVIDRWNVQLAARFEDYSDFGSDWNWKAASRFEIMEGLAVRGAVSTGFRAPSLPQQFFAAAATNNIGGVLVDAVTLPVGNPVAQALGSVPLKPETSFSWSGGVVFSAVPRLSVTVDYYQIDIDDRIVLTDNLSATRDAAGNPSGTNPGRGIAEILNNAGFTNVSAARFFFNGIDTRTRGLDAIATYRVDLGSAGSLAFTAGYNWTETRITGRQDTPGALNQVPGITLFGRLESLRIERGQPRDKLNLGVDWDWNWLGVTARTNRFGTVLAPGADAFNDVWLSPKWVTDLEVRAQPWGGLELAVGANNLFNTYPDQNPTGQGPDPSRAPPATSRSTTTSCPSRPSRRSASTAGSSMGAWPIASRRSVSPGMSDLLAWGGLGPPHPSVPDLVAQDVAPVPVGFKDLADGRVADGFVRIVGKQVLLADIGDIGRFVVLGEQMVERLVLVRPDRFGDGLPPFLGVVEFRIDIEDHAAERKHPVPDHVADAEARDGSRCRAG
jgi:iron complex outermembrane recepter protein